MSRRLSLYNRIKTILESARSGVLRTVNTTQVIANWLVGREIVEEEQQGKRRASYGKKAIEALSKKLQATFGEGYSVQNLFYMRQFYLTYQDLLSNTSIPHAPRGELMITAAHFQDERLFASRYKLHLPTEAELCAEIKREMGHLSPSLSTAAKKTAKTANGK